MPHIARQLQHNVLAPPPDAASTRTSTSNLWASSRQPNRRWMEISLEVMPIDSVTLSDGAV